MLAARALPLLLLAQGIALAYTVNISSGTRAIYLQVGNGSFTGTYSSGGTPGSNATINKVTVSVPALVALTANVTEPVADRSVVVPELLDVSTPSTAPIVTAPVLAIATAPDVLTKAARSLGTSLSLQA